MPILMRSWGEPLGPVSWRMMSRLALTSVMCVKVHVAIPASVLSSNTVDNASPQRNTSRRHSPTGGVRR
jgi:hypothetical protein